MWRLSPLLLTLGCASTDSDSHAPQDATPYATIVYNEDGLPDCVGSLSDAAFCDGWPYQTLHNGYGLPRWLWPYRGGGTVHHSVIREPETNWCADDEETALAIIAESWPSSVEYLAESYTRDYRWFDINYNAGGSSWSTFRIPRCSYFGELNWTETLGVELDPLYTLVNPSEDPSAFFDVAMEIERLRHAESSDLDKSVLYAVGSADDNGEWILKTCRVNPQPTYETDPGVHQVITQNTYTMTSGSGHARLTRELVRSVECGTD